MVQEHDEMRWDPIAMRDLARLELRPEELESALRSALANGEMIAMFQPQVRLPERRLRGFEVLVRWRHPRFGLLRPQRFIRLAERCAAAADLDLFALDQAAVFLHRLGARMPEELIIAVNASPRGAGEEEYAERAAAMARELLPGGTHLVVEVTERSPISAWRRSLRNLRRLKAAGVRVAIDDFGSGYASFGVVKRLQLDEIKIDRMLVRDTDPESAAILTAILEMARALGVDVVAEGVENAAQHQLLVALGCPAAQGFYYARPLPLAEAVTFVAESCARENGWRVPACV